MQDKKGRSRAKPSTLGTALALSARGKRRHSSATCHKILPIVVEAVRDAIPLSSVHVPDVGSDRRAYQQKGIGTMIKHLDRSLHAFVSIHLQPGYYRVLIVGSSSIGRTVTLGFSR